MDNLVEIFLWTHNFETGIPLIDEQHHGLVNLLNVLVSHIAYQSAAPEINAVFDELTAYTQLHFKTEEEIWGKHFEGDPWEAWHKHAHHDFILEVLRLKNEDQYKPLEKVIEDIVKFLSHWLAHHILESDKRMAKVVLALPTGVSLARAKEIANEEMLGTSKILLETVMSMYDILANRTVQLTKEIQKRKQIEEELRIAREKADAANRAKSVFLSNMSHEIRTPLNAVTGILYMLKRDPALSSIQKKQLDKIDRAGKHLLSVVNDILDLSKIEAGKFTIEERELSLDVLIANIASMLSDRLKEKNLSLIIENALFPTFLLGDSTRLQQALLNYANNAINFTDSGCIILRTVMMEDNKDSLLVRFEIQDTGIGIEQHALDKLFNAFEQAQTSKTRPYTGTGLGLAITKKLAELMGGTVGVESIYGEGSTFWFTTRLKKMTNMTHEKQLYPEVNASIKIQQDFKGKKILLVEDDIFNQEIAQMLLEDVGLAVTIAENGLEALEMCPRDDFALILMDMQMPKMNGIEATVALRQTESGQSIPILAMTANAFNEDRQRCLDAGMNDFISKPVDPEALYVTLLKWLNND